MILFLRMSCPVPSLLTRAVGHLPTAVEASFVGAQALRSAAQRTQKTTRPQAFLASEILDMLGPVTNAAECPPDGGDLEFGNDDDEDADKAKKSK